MDFGNFYWIFVASKRAGDNMKNEPPRQNLEIQ